MTSLFETVLNMSLTGGVVILAVLLMRLLMRKAPRKFCYLLWLVVAFRLVIPFSFESAISIFNLSGEMPAVKLPQTGTLEEAPEETPSVPETALPDGSETSEEVSFPAESLPEVNVSPEISRPAFEEEQQPVSPPAVTPEKEPQPIRSFVLPAVWLAGIAAMLVYSAVTYVKLKRCLATAVRLEGNVYGSDRIDTPFALGVFKPRIYIPFGLSDSAKEYVLAHESCHLKRLDHIVKPISFLILAIHWFNPLCWLAFHCMSLDMELSCDEAVLSRCGNEAMKKQYTQTLLSFAAGKKFPAPTPLSFSEGTSAKARVQNALRWKKPKTWLSLTATALCALLLLACASNAVATPRQAESSRGEESDPTSKEEESREEEPFTYTEFPQVEFPEVTAPEVNIPAFTETPEDFSEYINEAHDLEFVLNPDRKSYAVRSLGSCRNKKIRVPAYHMDGKPVTVIRDSAFRNRSEIIGVYLPDTVELVEQYAFYGCQKLEWIRIPDRATLKESAFACCLSLKSVTLPSTMTVMERSLLEACYSLKQVILPKGLRSIGENAFAGCNSLARINLPEGLQSIGRSAFKCAGLTALSVPDSVTSIGDMAFKECMKLEAIRLPAGLKALGTMLFDNCLALPKIALPEGLQTIGNSAFNNCRALTEIRIPDSVSLIYTNAFSHCISLKAITLSENLTQLPPTFLRGCTALEKLHIPKNVHTIRSDAFKGCTSLSLVQAEGAVTIESGAFSDCKRLKAVSFGTALCSIEEAFKGSPDAAIFYDGTMAEWNAIEAVDLYDRYHSDAARIICTDGSIPIP